MSHLPSTWPHRSQNDQFQSPGLAGLTQKLRSSSRQSHSSLYVAFPIPASTAHSDPGQSRTRVGGGVSYRVVSLCLRSVQGTWDVRLVRHRLGCRVTLRRLVWRSVHGKSKILYILFRCVKRTGYDTECYVSLSTPVQILHMSNVPR
jgi:hypothetical protein